MIIRFTQQSGGVHEFEVRHVAPVGLAGFSDYLAGRRLSFDVQMQGVVLSGPDLPIGADVEIQKTIEFRQAVRHFALVPGGVLPPDLMEHKTGLLFDRNVISELRRCTSGTLGEVGLEWLVAGAHVINPILGAFEGAVQRVQSLQEFLDEFELNRLALTRCLPDAECIEFDPEHLVMMHQQQLEFADRARLEADLLRSVAPWFADPLPERQLKSAESRLMEAVDAAGLKRLTAISLVLLAKLYEGNEDRPATRLLKLHEVGKLNEGWRQVAYNALADIRQLELLATAANQPHRFAAITSDKGLAQVWCGLRPFGQPSSDAQVRFFFDPDPALFPRLTGSVEALFERLTAGE